MGLERPNAEQLPQTDQRYKTRLVFAKAATAAALLAGLIAGGVFYTSGSSLFAASSGDDVSDADKAARIEAFNSLKSLLVSKVAEEDIPRAIDTMHLAPADMAKMRTEIGHAQVSGLPIPTDAPAGSSARATVSGKPDANAVRLSPPRRLVLHYLCPRRPTPATARRLRSHGSGCGIPMWRMEMSFALTAPGIRAR
jgi:hypothetical protein